MLYYNITMRNLAYWLLALAIGMAAFPTLADASDAMFFQPLASDKTLTLASFRGRPALIAFWRSDCPPCVAERPMLLSIARAHANLRVAIISLQDEMHTRKAFADLPGNMEVLLSKNDAGETLRALGDGDSALPYSVFLHADGSVCETRRGLLGTRIAGDWMKRC